jgi:DNA-binding transcriptional ArsR family regulator
MEPNISFIAGLIGDSTRSSMLTALMSGKALTATELATEAEVTAQTASSHLAKLVDGDLLVVRKQGRHRYFQLRGVEVAELLEKLLNITSSIEHSKTVTGPRDPDLKTARVCYDHLAGKYSVAVYDALAQSGYINDRSDETVLTESGKRFFEDLGVDFDSYQKTKRPLCKSCLDWSERRNHLAGILGQWVLDDIFKKRWAVKNLDSRTIQFSQKGLKLFGQKYGIADLSKH